MRCGREMPLEIIRKNKTFVEFAFLENIKEQLTSDDVNRVSTEVST